MNAWAYVLSTAAMIVLVVGYSLPAARDDDQDLKQMLTLQRKVVTSPSGDTALLADLQMAEVVYTWRVQRRARYRLLTTVLASLLLLASLLVVVVADV